MHKIAALSLMLLASPAVADPQCMSLETAQKKVIGSTTVSPMTDSQWNFLRGIYLLAPFTPVGLPPGDGAVLIQEESGSAVVLWTMGTLVCDPMPIPKLVMDFLTEVKLGKPSL